MLLDKLIVEWTYHSTGIEGNSLSLAETAKVAMMNLGVEGKPVKHINEVIDHKNALSKVFEWIFYDHVQKLTIEHIKDLHEILTYSQFVALKGQFRTNDVGVYRYDDYEQRKTDSPVSFLTFSAAEKLPELMNTWLEKFNECFNQDLEENTSIIHFTLLHNEFVSIHPFVDGNGRMVRLLSNAMMMSNDHAPVMIKRQHRDEYVGSLSSMNNHYSPPQTPNELNLNLSQCNNAHHLFQKIHATSKAEIKNILSSFTQEFKPPKATSPY